MTAEASRNAASRLAGSSYATRSKLFRSPARCRISSAARSERTAATQVTGASGCAVIHRRMAWPTALLAPVITTFIRRIPSQLFGVGHQRHSRHFVSSVLLFYAEQD